MRAVSVVSGMHEIPEDQMGKAFQLVINGHGNTVVSSLDLALRHFAPSLANGPAEYDTVGKDDEFPSLEAQGLAGSYAQRLRWLAEGRFETVEIVMHDTDSKPGFVTSEFSLDLVNDFDPAYELQAALYKTESTDEDIMIIGDELQIEIVDGIQEGRRFLEDDAAFVERLRQTERWMGGEQLIPADGDPAEILAGLPQLARQRFEEMAAKAFPDEVIAP